MIILLNFTRQRKKGKKINGFIICVSMAIGRNLERVRNTRKIIINMILRIPQKCYSPGRTRAVSA
jgi:hypothetical protein